MKRLLPLLVLLATLFVVRRAAANISAPALGGQFAGEATGVADVAITHEDLVLDVRHVAKDGRVSVAARYDLDSHAAGAFELVFVSGAEDLRDIAVTLDGVGVTTRSETRGPLPTRWRAPERTPHPSGVGTLEYANWLHAGRVEPGQFTFTIPLTPGKHALSVTYTAAALAQIVGDPTIAHQFAYVLAPASTWASFGDLDVIVHLPAGFRSAIDVPLTREGDTLRGHFQGLPADAIGLAVQAPANGFYEARIAGLASIVAVLVAGAMLLPRIARRLRGGVGARILLAAAWSGLFFVAGVVTLYAPYEILAPATRNWHAGYGALGWLLLVLLGALTVFGLGVFVGRAPRPHAHQ